MEFLCHYHDKQFLQTDISTGSYIQKHGGRESLMNG